MLSLCPVHSLLPAPLSAPLSTAPERRRRAQPTPRMAHTAPHSATPPPMRHTYHPKNLPIPTGAEKIWSLSKKVYRSFFFSSDRRARESNTGKRVMGLEFMTGGKFEMKLNDSKIKMGVADEGEFSLGLYALISV